MKKFKLWNTEHEGRVCNITFNVEPILLSIIAFGALYVWLQG